jgi:hypothetical protein
MDSGPRAPRCQLVVSNEFATVAVQVDVMANGQRLEITNLSTGLSIHLDAMELASLTTASHGDFDYLVRRFVGSLL